jgi:hypothetical protein
MYIKINRQKKHFDRIGGKSTSKEKKNTKPKKSNNMKKTTVIRLRIAPEEKTQVQYYCKEKKQSLSNLIRRELNKKIENEKQFKHVGQ